MGAIGGAGFRTGDYAAEGAGDGPAPAEAAPLRLVTDLLKDDPTLASVLRGERSLKQGARGEAVRKVQEALRKLGADISPDGGFGPKTVAAVKAFQKAAGLTADGVVGAKTLDRIDGKLDALSLAPNPYDDPDLLDGGPAVRPTPVRTTTIAPRPAPAPAPAPREPTPYDTNWFTDADSLPALPETRRYLDQALRTGRHGDITALRPLDILQASTAEKAKLVEHLLAGHTEDAAEAWILEMLQHRQADGPAVLAEVARRGKLPQLFADFHGDNYARLLRLAPALVRNAKEASSVAGAILQTDNRQNRLGAHHVFDAARAGGYLDATLAQLKAAHPASPVVNDLIAQAKPTRRPEIVAHRGGPPQFVENTMPAIRAALEAGAECVEIDITVTKSDDIVLWHDYEPGGIVGTMRELGMEPGMGYKPAWPPEGHAARKPIYDLHTSAFRANMGYAKRDGNILTNERAQVEIPLLQEVLRFAKEHPELKRLCLDVKLPPDRPDVQHRFGVKLKELLRAHGMEDRVYLMHNTASVVSNLKRDLGERVKITHDVEIVSLAPSASSYSAVDSANRLGNRMASVGRPRLGIDAYDQYLKVLKNDRRKLDGAARPQELVTWTINDELELREILAVGVDGIVTDNPALLARLVQIYKL